MAMTAMTSNTWIIEPALKTKNPKSQPIIRTTATTYKMDPII